MHAFILVFMSSYHFSDGKAKNDVSLLRVSNYGKDGYFVIKKL
jgi:hypothetical protein